MPKNFTLQIGFNFETEATEGGSRPLAYAFVDPSGATPPAGGLGSDNQIFHFETGDGIHLEIFDLTPGGGNALMRYLVRFQPVKGRIADSNSPFSVDHYLKYSKGEAPEGEAETALWGGPYPVWHEGEAKIEHTGTYSFTVRLTARGPRGMVDFVLDPEMEIGSGSGGELDLPTE